MLDTITLDEPSRERDPILKNRRLGESATIALVKFEQRDVLKDQNGELRPVLKSNGKPRQELVVTGVVISTDMVAGIGGEEAVPAPGDRVRKILRGRTFGDWIEATNKLKPRQVGDVITFTSDNAVVYDQAGKPTAEITDQEALDAVPRGRSVGVYGQLSIRRATEAEAAWVAKATEAYHALNAKPAVVLDDNDGDDGDPF